MKNLGKLLVKDHTGENGVNYYIDVILRHR